MRLPKITIRRDKQRGRWLVDIPDAVSESGIRERKLFATKNEAEGFKIAQEARLRNEGTFGVPLLTPTQRHIAAQAFRLLAGHAETQLIDAVREMLQSRDRRARSVTLREAFTQWQSFTTGKSRNGKNTSPAYIRQIRCTIPRFSCFHGKLVCDLSPEDVEKMVEGLPAHSRNAALRILRACLNYAKQRGWLEQSPIRPLLHFVGTGYREPSVLSAAQVAALLRTCRQVRPELLGYYVLALFAGIRPTDELLKLRWENVHGDGGKTIHIPADVAKTRFQRHIHIEPLLTEWLDFLNAPQFGPVVPSVGLIRNRRIVQRAAGIVPWPQDVMRHTYASCWMALHRDEDLCRDNMGHRTKDELHKHYRKHLSEQDAKAFWSLRPCFIFPEQNGPISIAQ